MERAATPPDVRMCITIINYFLSFINFTYLNTYYLLYLDSRKQAEESRLGCTELVVEYLSFLGRGVDQ